jgi:hypothetical protein
MKAFTRWQAAVLGKVSIAIALSSSLSCLAAVTAARNAATVQEFKPIQNEPGQEKVQLKRDLTSAVQRAGDAVNQASQEVLTNRLKQLSAQAGKVIRSLSSSNRIVSLRAKVDVLVSKLDALESDALKATEENEDCQDARRFQLEDRLTAAVSWVKQAVQNRDPNAQNELDELEADAAALKGTIRRARNADDFNDSQRHVTEIEDRSQRLAKIAQTSSRRFDMTQFLVGMGLLASTATGVVLTFLFLRMRHQIDRLRSVSGNTPRSAGVSASRETSQP